VSALRKHARSFGPHPCLLRCVGYLQNRGRSARIAGPVYLSSRKVELPDGDDPLAGSIVNASFSAIVRARSIFDYRRGSR
jgi:hypothetical protein